MCAIKSEKNYKDIYPLELEIKKIIVNIKYETKPFDMKATLPFAIVHLTYFTVTSIKYLQALKLYGLPELPLTVILL